MRGQISAWVLAALFAATPAAAQSVNTKAVAQLRWYQVNHSATYYLGPGASIGIGFDGEDIWVESGNDNVLKLRPSDGKVLGNASAQDTPEGMAFDGTNLWVANYGSNSVSKIRTSDGTNLGNFNLALRPGWVEFNGTNIVVIGYDLSTYYPTIVILRPSDGTILHTTTLNSIFPAGPPEGAAFDGTYVWIADAEGARLDTVDQNGAPGPILQLIGTPYGMVFDGTFMWVLLTEHDEVLKVARNGTSANALSIVGTYPVPTPFGLGFDGQTIWVLSPGGIVKIRASDGKNLGTFPVPGIGSSPDPFAFDGTNMWMTCYPDSLVESVCKL